MVRCERKREIRAKKMQQGSNTASIKEVRTSMIYCIIFAIFFENSRIFSTNIQPPTKTSAVFAHTTIAFVANIKFTFGYVGFKSKYKVQA